MKSVGLILALAAMVTGLTAAGFWWWASTVEPVPSWVRSGGIEPVDPSQSAGAWASAAVVAAIESAKRNKIAAKWTAATAVLTALSSVALAWPTQC